jgi:V-type H+-transporting ATPase subunit E
MLNDVYAAAVARLAKLAEEESEEYAALVGDMILQGLIKLNDEEVTVRCRKGDMEMVSDAIPAVSESYISKTGNPLALRLDEDKFLPEDCAGGVSLLSAGGRIIVENTFESRLQVAYQQNLPLIRAVLFDEQ